MRPAYRPAPARTQADRKLEAIRFVWEATDRVIPTVTAESIALMKGVTAEKDIAEIRNALAARREGFNV